MGNTYEKLNDAIIRSKKRSRAGPALDLRAWKNRAQREIGTDPRLIVLINKANKILNGSKGRVRSRTRKKAINLRETVRNNASKRFSIGDRVTFKGKGLFSIQNISGDIISITRDRDNKVSKVNKQFISKASLGNNKIKRSNNNIKINTRRESIRAPNELQVRFDRDYREIKKLILKSIDKRTGKLSSRGVINRGDQFVRKYTHYDILENGNNNHQNSRHIEEILRLLNRYDPDNKGYDKRKIALVSGNERNVKTKEAYNLGGLRRVIANMTSSEITQVTNALNNIPKANFNPDDFFGDGNININGVLYSEAGIDKFFNKIKYIRKFQTIFSDIPFLNFRHKEKIAVISNLHYLLGRNKRKINKRGYKTRRGPEIKRELGIRKVAFDLYSKTEKYAIIRPKLFMNSVRHLPEYTKIIKFMADVNSDRILEDDKHIVKNELSFYRTLLNPNNLLKIARGTFGRNTSILTLLDKIRVNPLHVKEELRYYYMNRYNRDTSRGINKLYGSPKLASNQRVLDLMQIRYIKKNWQELDREYRANIKSQFKRIKNRVGKGNIPTNLKSIISNPEWLNKGQGILKDLLWKTLKEKISGGSVITPTQFMQHVLKGTFPNVFMPGITKGPISGGYDVFGKKGYIYASGKKGPIDYNFNLLDGGGNIGVTRKGFRLGSDLKGRLHASYSSKNLNILLNKNGINATMSKKWVETQGAFTNVFNVTGILSAEVNNLRQALIKGQFSVEGKNNTMDLATDIAGMNIAFSSWLNKIIKVKRYPNKKLPVVLPAEKAIMLYFNSLFAQFTRQIIRFSNGDRSQFSTYNELRTSMLQTFYDNSIRFRNFRGIILEKYKLGFSYNHGRHSIAPKTILADITRIFAKITPSISVSLDRPTVRNRVYFRNKKQGIRAATQQMLSNKRIIEPAAIIAARYGNKVIDYKGNTIKLANKAK